MIIRALLDLEQGETTTLCGLQVHRWGPAAGDGWTVGEPGRSAGSNCLATIVRILSKGAPQSAN